MKSKILSELSKEQLLIEIKSRKNVFYIYCFFVSIMVCSGIFLTIKKGFGVFSYLPIAFLPILIMVRKNYTDSKKELQLRK